MESEPDLKSLGILENISHFFDFLFTRGFHILSLISIDDQNWQVTMMAEDYIIRIFCYRGDVDLALSTLRLYNAIGFFALDDLIYCVNGKEDFSDPLEGILIHETQNVEQLAWRLEKHIDKILDNLRNLLVLPRIDPPSTGSNNPGSVFHNDGPGILF